jgi:hypothetical protein
MRPACAETPIFNAAGSQPVLWTIHDQVLPSDRWWHRTGIGGTNPVRFPHDEDRGDADGTSTEVWRLKENIG